MTHFQNAFISYGRADSKSFAMRLNQRLIEAGLDIWLDFDDIPLGVDYQKQIEYGINSADNFLFIISPHAVNSPYCILEIDYALKQNKRIIPLLHVEEISHGIWQERNPQGSEQDWSIYQSEGKHSSYPNMHPAISKINWICFREGIDDFDQSVLNLLNVIHRQKTYVRQHTELLAQALKWQQQQRESHYLLVGEARQNARDWLTQEFKDEQPPCIPTDLHAEFITESIKNGQNLMTQVFLAHAAEDKDSMQTIRRLLWHEAFTIWTNQTDIRTGEDFKRAVHRGIEETDNVVLLLSPQSLHSKYCQYELSYAMSLNKRIIPILIASIDNDQVQSTLKSLQYIDFLPDANEGMRSLLKALREDAAYYEYHKLVLVKALKWKRQQRNPSILLRGYDLRQTETWWQTAQTRSQHQPTKLQIEFIQASLSQPPAQALDVFISYSRTDVDIARFINDALQIQGKTTWFDQESIAVGTDDFQEEIKRGIEISDNFVFILSPRAISSQYCAEEVNHATNLNKRIITILHQSIDTLQLHPDLARVQWIDFTKYRQEFTPKFNQLIRTLDTDREHVHSHTKWLQRSLEWESKHQSTDLLLRGNELAIAEQWLQEALDSNKNPPVTKMHCAFIQASQDAAQIEIHREKRRMLVLKSLLILVSGLLTVSVVATIVAWRQRTQLALDATAETIQRTLITNPVNGLRSALSLAGKSQSQLKSVRPSVRSSLRDAIGVTVEQNRLVGHRDAVWSAVVSPDGQRIASGSFDNTIRLWDFQGNLIGKPFEGHQDTIWSVAFSPDGRAIASASSDNTIRIWDLDGNALTEPLQGHSSHVKSVIFSPDGTLLASGSADGTVRLWDRRGTVIRSIQASSDIIRSVAFSPDGNTIASIGEDGQLRLWSRDGTLLTMLPAHDGRGNSVAFRPDGQAIATGGQDDVIRIWDRQGNLIFTLEGHDDDVMSVAFSPNGEWLVSASDDNSVRVWDQQGNPIAPPLIGHDYYVYSATYSPDNRTIVSSSEDQTIRLWDMDELLLRQPLLGHESPVNTLAISGDGQILVSGDTNGILRFWTPAGATIGVPIRGHTGEVLSVAMNDTGNLIGSSGADGEIRLWNEKGIELRTFSGNQGAVNDLAIHPSQPLLVSAGTDGTIRLWDDQGNPLGQPIQGHNGNVRTVAFSPDGKLIASGGGDDRTIRLWDLDGNPIGQPFIGHTDDINDVTFSSHGEMLASASRDRTLRLWNLDGEIIAPPFRGHTSMVNAVAFSPRWNEMSPELSYILVSASRDQTLQLWDLNGTPIGSSLVSHRESVLDTIFSPDGQLIFSAGADGAIRRWEGGTLSDWLILGCDRLSRHALILEGSEPEDQNVREICDF